jgi:large subunit ribosomal protein L30
MAKKLKITQVRSVINRNKKQRGTIDALGIKRMNHTVIQDDNSVIRGMVNKVIHLVKVEEVEA